MMNESPDRVRRLKEIYGVIAPALDGAEATVEEAVDAFVFCLGISVSKLCETDDEAVGMIGKLQDMIIASVAFHMRRCNRDESLH